MASLFRDLRAYTLPAALAADQRRLLVIARGSLYELEHWIASADARGLLAAREMDSKVEEVAKTLSGLTRALGPT